MGLWDEVLDELPELRERLERIEGTVGEFRFRLPERTFDLPRGFAPSLGLALDGRFGPPGGIYGHGVLFGTPPRPIVVVDQLLAPYGGAPHEVTLFGALSSAIGMGDYLPRGTYAVGIPPPEPQQARFADDSGLAVRVGGQRATLGLPVSTPSVVQGFTTAGHAVNDVPVPVRDSRGAIIGTAVTARNLSGMLPTVGPVNVDSAVADIAIIDMDNFGTQSFAPPTGTFAVRPARSREGVSLFKNSKARSWVRSVVKDFALRLDLASWGEVSLTAEAMSRGGDSGSLVVGDDGAVVGHIVAGHEGVYSVVQDMDYCLREVGAWLR